MNSALQLDGRLRTAAGSLLVFLVLVSCGTPSPVRIGVVLDGDGMRGALLAAADVNAAGGVDGATLELRAINGLSSTSARDALSSAETLANDPTILAVVGHTNSAASLAAAQVYNERHIVQIAPTSTAPLYSFAGLYSFRLVPSDVHQGVMLGDIVAADPTHPRTAMLYVNDDYGRALHTTLGNELAARGIVPVYEAPYEEREHFSNVDGLARALAHANTELLVWVGRSAELRQLLPSLKALLPHVRILASDGFSGPQLTAHPDSLFYGIRYVRFLDPQSTEPKAQHLAEYYRAHWKGEFTDQYSLSYDAVRLLAEALRHGRTREDVRHYLTELGHANPAFPGVSQVVQFDVNGDVAPHYLLAEVTATGSVLVPVSLP